MHWLFRMSKWARNPPSARRVRLVLLIIVICLVVYAVERWIGWPDWATVEGRGRFMRP
ncbi:hypothetical protein [Thalassovita aquimarina]|uniref:Uncharacterized protein n=1 Tax=Thalassovita aquimarina TaxID=2785917 RepID=A0ABS5HMN3_9RHOB|nr:hypothetical protein [Thalassovita aquimarina]MBR9649813.1 hypothetical protein [Thalassovita aquimarina]